MSDRGDAAAERFLAFLFAGYPLDEGLSCEIRALKPGAGEDAEDRVVRRWFGLEPEYLARAAAYCLELAPTHDVYVGVLPRVGRGGFSRDVMLARSLWVDLDAGTGTAADAVALLKRSALPCPDYVVGTASGGAHLYWALAEPIDLRIERERFRDLAKRLVHAIGGTPPGPHADPAASDEARVLRVPGTLYHKRHPPTVVESARRREPGRMTARWWRGRLPSLPVAPTRTIARDRSPGIDQRTDAEIVETACRSSPTVSALMSGDISRYDGDDSRADMALMRSLAYWAGNDPVRMERMFAFSLLARRAKWNRADYRRRTIDRALRS